MFKFDGSSSALIKNDYKETSEASKRRDKILICPPDHNNIMYIFIPFMCFVEDIEHILEMQQGFV